VVRNSSVFHVKNDGNIMRGSSETVLTTAPWKMSSGALFFGKPLSGAGIFILQILSILLQTPV